MKQQTFDALQDEIDQLDRLARRLARRLIFSVAAGGICAGLLIGIAVEDMMTRHVAASLEALP